MAGFCELTGKGPMKGSIIWRSGKAKKQAGSMEEFCHGPDYTPRRQGNAGRETADFCYLRQSHSGAARAVKSNLRS